MERPYRTSLNGGCQALAAYTEGKTHLIATLTDAALAWAATAGTTHGTPNSPA